jgi:hypothetical protein
LKLITRIYFAPTRFDFRKGDIEWVADLLRPIHDRGTKAINTDACGFQFSYGQVEGFVGNVVKIGFGEAGHFDSAWLEVLPTQFQRRLDLAVNRVCPFVANAGENHTSGS